MLTLQGCRVDRLAAGLHVSSVQHRTAGCVRIVIRQVCGIGRRLAMAIWRLHTCASLATIIALN